MAPLEIRLFGDPVLKQKAAEITDVDGALVRLADDMLVTMYDAPGLGLAATQVGVQKRLFVYDIGDGPQTIVNPVITEAAASGCTTRAACRSPGSTVEIVRPKEIHLTGYDLDGNEVVDRGRRVDGPAVPARARPPRRRADARAARRRAARARRCASCAAGQIEPAEPAAPKTRISLS